MKSRYALLALTLASIGTASHAAMTPELEKSIDGMVTKMINCQKKTMEADPNFKAMEPMIDQAMQQARQAIKADAAKFNAEQSKAAIACMDSMKNASCDAMQRSETPECKKADKILK